MKNKNFEKGYKFFKKCKKIPPYHCGTGYHQRSWKPDTRNEKQRINTVSLCPRLNPMLYFGKHSSSDSAMCYNKIIFLFVSIVMSFWILIKDRLFRLKSAKSFTYMLRDILKNENSSNRILKNSVRSCFIYEKIRSFIQRETF